MIAFLLLGLLGHAFLWIGLVNRLHAVGLPRRMLTALSLLCLACSALIPVGVLYWLAAGGWQLWGQWQWTDRPRPQLAAFLAYVILCSLVAAVTVGRWFWQVLRRPPHVLRVDRTRSVSLAPATAAVASAEHAHHFLVRLPGNQTLQLDLTERTIEVPRLPPALDGLCIAHISDFHFTGRVGKAYFHKVVCLSNEAQPDLVAITGDLVDRSECIDWIPDTLGKLAARHGVYYVLGNHDLRCDVRRLRATLAACGLIDLGGRWVELSVRGQRVILAGNELPWLPPAADMKHCPTGGPDGRPLRIVLSHSPDQLDWARAQDADLLLAGHTHGGQIRLPLLGAILTPSWQGVKYASGVFYAPPTIMHVTRGVSGLLPVRLNCPPEMARLVLHMPRWV